MMTKIFLAVIFLVASVTAYAQGYTINGQPTNLETTQYLMNVGLPFGNYWLTQDGYWGVMGDPTPLGNIYNPQSSNGQSQPSVVHPSSPEYGPSLYKDSNNCFYSGDYSNCN